MISTATLLALTALLVGLVIGALIASLSQRRRSEALHVELAVLKAQVRTQDQLDKERAHALELAVDRVKSSFDTVAGQSLRDNSETFLRLAREHLGQHQQTALASLTEREKAIETMLAPIRDALGKTEVQIQQLEKDRAESFGNLKASLEAVTLGQQALQRETGRLVNALRRPEVRGQWGELTLRRLAELAGMIEHCDFSEQTQVRTDGGHLRPDMIVHMPDGRDLVVDVKTPLDAYLDAVDATNDELRGIALKRHAQCGCRARARTGGQELLEPVREEPGLRDPVHSWRSVPVGRARRIADLAGGCDSPAGHHRHTYQFRRAAQGRCLRLASDRAGRERRDDPPSRGRSVQAPRHLQLRI